MYPDIPRRTIPRYSPIPGPLEMAAGLLFTRRLGLLGAITLAAVAKQVSGAEIAAGFDGWTWTMLDVMIC